MFTDCLAEVYLFGTHFKCKYVPSPVHPSTDNVTTQLSFLFRLQRLDSYLIVRKLDPFTLAAYVMAAVKYYTRYALSTSAGYQALYSIKIFSFLLMLLLYLYIPIALHCNRVRQSNVEGRILISSNFSSHVFVINQEMFHERQLLRFSTLTGPPVFSSVSLCVMLIQMRRQGRILETVNSKQSNGFLESLAKAPHCSEGGFYAVMWP